VVEDRASSRTVKSLTAPQVVQIEFAKRPSAGGDVPSSDSSGSFSADRVGDPDPGWVVKNLVNTKIFIIFII
jgi:hypothetical protein